MIQAAAMAQTTRPSAAPIPIIPVAPEDATLGVGKVIGLDYYYNHQFRNGKQFHYVWEDTAASGYSRFGDIWKQYGATLAKLEEAPTLDDLKKFSVYIICNPNTPVKAYQGKANYIMPPDIDAIVTWVQSGGVLAIFANDQPNGGEEFDHLNQLSTKFGITFNNVLRNQVPNARDRRPGCFAASTFGDTPILKGLQMIYMKEVCTMDVTDPAKALLIAPKEKGAPGTDTIMAEAHVGKGLVFAVCDPWVYNEYIDVTAPNLPIQNRQGAMNLTKYLLQAASAPQGN
jgi:unsaturated rhamnogalacturonyl hydrolase